MKTINFLPIWILPFMLILCAASCRNEASRATDTEIIEETVNSTQAETGMELIYPVRKINEAEVAYPEGQKIEIEPINFVDANEGKIIKFVGFNDGNIIFDGVSRWLAENPAYSFNINIDNFEPISVLKDTVPTQLKDGNHIFCLYPVDQNKISIKSSPVTTSSMFRIEGGTSIKRADAPVLMLYNQPRRTYMASENVYLDYMLINTYGDLSYKVDVKIDGIVFKQIENRPYIIKGLKPGRHYVEMTLTGGGEPYNVPLNPARMQFVTQ